MYINRKSVLTLCGVLGLMLSVNPDILAQAKSKTKHKATTVATKSKDKQEADSTSTKNEYKKLYQDAQVSEGLMRVVKQKDDYYLDVPTTLLGKDMLVVNKLRRVPKELNEAGVNKGVNYENKMIRLEWDKVKKAILVRESRPLPASPRGEAINLAVQDNYISPLIASVKVEGVSADSTRVLIKVNDLYNGSETSLNNVLIISILGHLLLRTYQEYRR